MYEQTVVIKNIGSVTSEILDKISKPYLDKDKDGYYAEGSQAKEQEESPGEDWVEGTSDKEDCDDTVHADINNNDCSQKATDVSDDGICSLKAEEGFRSNEYKVGGKGNWTVGYGHEKLPGEDFSGGITEEQGEELLRQDILKPNSFSVFIPVLFPFLCVKILNRS